MKKIRHRRLMKVLWKQTGGSYSKMAQWFKGSKNYGNGTYIYELNKKCEHCDDNNTEENLRGSEGIVYDPSKSIHYLFIEYFAGEPIRLEVKFCSECARAF